MTLTVERLQPTDVDDVVHHAQALHQESPFYRQLTFDTARFFDELQGMMQKDTEACWIARKDGDLLGWLAAYRAPIFVFEEQGVFDQSVYIAPRYRRSFTGGRALMGLISAVVAWAQQAPNVCMLSFGSRTQMDALGYCRQLAKLGFVHDTTSMRLELI